MIPKIDWSNPLTKGLFALFVPEGNSFREVIRNLTPTTINGTSARTIIPQGTGPLGLHGKSFSAVDFGTYSNQYWFNFDFDLGIADGAAITLGALYAGTDIQTTAFGQIIGVFDSSAENMASIEVTPTTNVISALEKNASYQRVAASTAVRDNGSEKQFALVGANFYPSSGFGVWVDGVEENTNTGETRTNQSLYDRIAIGHYATTSNSDWLAGSVGLAFVYKDRNLTAAEWQSLARNPWQIFKPRLMFAHVARYDPTIVLEQTGPITINESISFGIDAGTTQVNILTAGVSQAFTIDLAQTQDGSLGTTTLTITLVDSVGTQLSSLTGLSWAWFDQATPDIASTPIVKGAGETTDSSGVLSIDITGTTLTTGQTGMLALKDSTGMIYALYRITL